MVRVRLGLVMGALGTALVMAACSGAAEANVDDCLEAEDPEACYRALDDAESPGADADGGFDAFQNPEAAGGDGDDDAGGACFALLVKACGSATDASCATEPGCTAAQLLATYEPWACEDALNNEQSYPPCQASGCELLVGKVCGEVNDCAATATCDVARQWQTQAAEADKAADRDEAEGACVAALADDVVFPSCD
jgi:hypothetical protein